MTRNSEHATKTLKIIYVTRDIERALGKEPIGDYYIVANKTPYAETVHAKYPENVFLFEGKNAAILGTYDLLTLPEVEESIRIISSGNVSNILVFKNTLRIEELCKQKKWNLLNPSAALSEKIENKISQVAWLADFAKYLPEHQIRKTTDLQWKSMPWMSKPFILQWAHGHTGESTIFVRNEKELAALKEKFPEREARVTEYIRGPMFTVNTCVSADALFIGNISYQITGILPFTDNPMTTIGNDWSLTHSILSPEKTEKLREIAETIGTHMQKSGWLGLFGIDCIYDEERDNLHLIEINARQAASTTYESQLQNSFRKHLPDASDTPGAAETSNSASDGASKKVPALVNIFESHLAALQKETSGSKAMLIEINDGAQIIQRASILPKQNNAIIAASAFLHDAGFTIIEYPNTKPGSDLLRIQSTQGIMETHMKFNSRGKKIVDILLA